MSRSIIQSRLWHVVVAAQNYQTGRRATKNRFADFCRMPLDAAIAWHQGVAVVKKDK
jgi:hypothetical protein